VYVRAVVCGFEVLYERSRLILALRLAHAFESVVSLVLDAGTR
jgi:hypothetical protein